MPSSARLLMAAGLAVCLAACRKDDASPDAGPGGADASTTRTGEDAGPGGSRLDGASDGSATPGDAGGAADTGNPTDASTAKEAAGAVDV